jgi:hypothetical protein
MTFTTRRPSTAINLGIIGKESRMTLELIRNASHVVAQGRAIALGGVVALFCSACASEETVATVPAGSGMTPPMMAAANDPPKQAASAPLGYPWATNGASLPSAVAKAPTVTR